MPKQSQSVARTPSARSSPRAARPPALIAIETLAKLVTAGAPTRRLVATTTSFLADWRAEPISAGDLREQVEKLRDDVEAGLEAADTFLVEAETDGQRRSAKAQVDGLTAIRDVLTRELERR